MKPLSIFIITKNEEHNLPRCLKDAAGLADEIVVLDSGSTDQTEQIARQFGAAFHYQKFDGFGRQKYSAERLCKNEWVLNLDADEFLTPEVKEEIRVFLSSGDTQAYDGARLKTVNVYPNASRPRLFADFHNYIRLYNRNRLNYDLHPTRDVVASDDESRIAQLKGIALHYSFESIEALEAKARARAKFYYEQEKPGFYLKNLMRAPFEFIWSFFKCYCLRRHFTGGYYGLRNSFIYAKYRHIRIWQRVLKRSLLD